MGQDGFILILGGETGICEVAINVTPLMKSAIIEHLQIICDDEGNDAICEAFFEHDETAYTPVAILEGMNLLEADVKVENIFEGLALDSVVFRE